MRKLREPITFLTAEEMETIHRNALRILAEVGMKIDHNEALDYLAAAGCKINRNKKEVKFPQDIVQKYVDKMRLDFTTRTEPEKMAVRYSHIRFRKEDFRIHEDFTVNTGGFCVFIYDLNGVRRPATLQDTRDSLKLAAQLDEITYTGLPVAAQEVPPDIRPIAMAAELVKATDKLGGIETFNKFDIEYICRIGEVVRGSKEELKRNPVLIGYAEARTPLAIDNNMAEVFVEYVKRGMPQSLDTMPNAGATSPMNPAGTLAVAIAETLGGMVLAYSIDENACVTVDVTPSFCDMSTGIFKYAGPERVSLLGACIQMIGKYYGCPNGVHGGKTDSGRPDIRCGMEKAISMLMPVLCGAVGFGTVGHIDAITFSPLQLVLDNEIARYVRAAVKGFEVSDEAINVDLIKRVGIGGNYLQEVETAMQFRDFLDTSPFFTAQPCSRGDESDKQNSWEKMAQDKAHHLLSNEIESPLNKEQIKEVDNIVQHARLKLKERNG